MNKKFDGILKIICLFLCTLLFIFLTLSLTLKVFISITNTENITKLVSNVEQKIVFEGSNELFEGDSPENSKYKIIIDELINSQEFKKIVGKSIGNGLENILYNKNHPPITSSEIAIYFNENIDKIINDFDIVLTSNERHMVINKLLAYSEKISQELDFETIFNEKANQQTNSNIRFVFNGPLEKILLIINIVLVLLIILCSLSIYRFAIWTGITTLLVGLSFTVLPTIFYNLINALSNKTIPEYLITFLNETIFIEINNVGVIVISAGITQIIYYYLVKKTIIK